MVDIRFEDEEVVRTSHKQQKLSRVTKFFIDHSGGLLKTEKQATLAELVVAIVAFMAAAYFISTSVDTTASLQPSEDIINSPLLNGER